MHLPGYDHWKTTEPYDPRDELCDECGCPLERGEGPSCRHCDEPGCGECCDCGEWAELDEADGWCKSCAVVRGEQWWPARFDAEGNQLEPYDEDDRDEIVIKAWRRALDA